MRLVIQRAVEPVLYRGAYIRTVGAPEEPARVAVVLGGAGEPEADAAALSRLLGLVLALGDGAGGAPIRQLWLQADGSVRGKRDSGLADRQIRELERLARRVRAEWERFVDNALARLRGEARGDAHFRYPAGAWDPEQPTVLVTAWPPMEGEALPRLE